MGNVMLTEVPLVADVGYGLDDLIAAVEQLHDAGAQAEGHGARHRGAQVQRLGAGRCARWSSTIPDWDASADDRRPRSPGRSRSSPTPTPSSCTRRARWSCTASTSTRIGGRELFFYYGAHLGSGVGTAAGVKLARPNQQVICLVGDGSFIFGPTALWNMARLELPVITVVYNNHAYSGPHSRVIKNVPGGRMVQTGQFFHDYLGNPDMNMAAIAKGFGVEAKWWKARRSCAMRLRARASIRSRASPI